MPDVEQTRVVTNPQKVEQELADAGFFLENWRRAAKKLLDKK